MSNDDYLANRVSQLVVKTFNDLKLKAGKPTIRSNGVKEWTVLSGIVAMIPNPDTEEEELYPICISTGVKTLPDSYRSYSNGLMVHDSHAEILSIRLFNWFLIDEVEKMANNNKYMSKIIEKNDDSSFKIKTAIKLCLYVSEPPCGDSSMSYIADDQIPWNEDDQPLKKGKIDLTSFVIRGRHQFGSLGIVRTKPGRPDSLVSYSKSCSDKLCLKQLTGLTNAFTSELFPQNIFLDYMILPKDKNSSDDNKRCFETRFKFEDVPVKYLKIIGCDETDYEFKKPGSSLKGVAGNDVPSPLSLLHIIPTNTTQVLNNGVRNGSFIKKKPPKLGGASIVCNQQLFNKIRPYINLKDSIKYQEYKESKVERQDLKSCGRRILGNWPKTDLDDFDLV